MTPKFRPGNYVFCKNYQEYIYEILEMSSFEEFTKSNKYVGYGYSYKNDDNKNNFFYLCRRFGRFKALENIEIIKKPKQTIIICEHDMMPAQDFLNQQMELLEEIRIKIAKASNTIFERENEQTKNS